MNINLQQMKNFQKNVVPCCGTRKDQEADLLEGVSVGMVLCEYLVHHGAIHQALYRSVGWKFS